MSTTVNDSTRVIETSEQREDSTEVLRVTGTVLPADAPPETPPPSKVVIGGSREDILMVVGAMAASIAVGLLCSELLHLMPTIAAPLVGYIWFVAVLVLLISVVRPMPIVTDRFWAIMLWTAAGLVLLTLGTVIIYTASKGGDFYTRMNFWTQDMFTTGPLAPANQGGIFFALIATLQQIGIALLITVPLATITAVFLSEVGGRFSHFVRTVVEAMTALPSVVAGLFIYASFVVPITKTSSGFAASLALSVLMLPIMVRSATVVLRLVPGNLREAGLALGADEWSVVRHVVLPTVRSGLMTAIILGTAHGIGETAPVMLTSGVTQNTNLNPFDNPQTSLPLAALEFVKMPQPQMQERGFATATILLFLVLVLFTLARLVGGQEAGAQSSRQARRAQERSAATLARIEAGYRQPQIEQLFETDTEGQS